MNLIFRSSAFVLMGLLQACSGEEDSNFAPSVSAGDDRVVNGGREVVLTATAEDSDGSIASYIWSQTSGDAVTLVDADEAAMSFEAPIADQSQVLEFKVIVADNAGARTADSIQVTVNAGIETPDNLRVRLVGLNAIVEWDTVDKAEAYYVYTAFESFSGLADISNYAALEEATQIAVDVPSEEETPIVQLRNLDDDQRYFFTVTAAFTTIGATEATESMPADSISRLLGGSFEESDPLNDTTVLNCLDADRVWSDCPVDGLAMQDGDAGRTAEDAADTLVKSGTGVAGFDFTLLDASGEAVSAGNSDAECLRDNVTGLLWELKDSYDAMRRPRNSYSWYDPDDDINGGDVGLEDGPDCGGGVCNTYAYITRLNQDKLCGETSWSLPTVRNMRSIGDIGLACTFDGDGCRYDLESYYWTRTSFAPDTSKAIQVTLNGRTDIPMLKSDTARLIAVAVPAEEE